MKENTTNEHPMQPVEIDEGVARFKRNSLVCYLLDSHPMVDMNHLAILPNIPQEDREQFAQLIGYSVSGFGDLSYASAEVVAIADQAVEELTKEGK